MRMIQPALLLAATLAAAGIASAELPPDPPDSLAGPHAEFAAQYARFDIDRPFQPAAPGWKTIPLVRRAHPLKKEVFGYLPYWFRDRYQYLTIFTGVFVFLVILHLVRRYRMHKRYALWWLSSALVVLVLGFLPREVDVIATYFGINYPPILTVVVALCIILVKLATMDIGRTKNELAVRRLAQQLALLEKKLEENTTGIRKDYRGGEKITPVRDR